MIAVGIDIAKAKFDAAVLDQGQYRHKEFANQAKGFAEFLRWLGNYPAETLHLCMEATHRYGFALAGFLCQQDLRVSIVNPARVKAFASSELRRNKTDRLDAALIARFCAEKTPRVWTPPTPQQREFQALFRRWENLKLLRSQELTRSEGETIAPVLGSLKEVIAYLDQRIKAIESALDALLTTQPIWLRRFQLLTSIPGVGKVTAYLLLAEVDFDLFDHPNQLVAFAGLNPKQNQSGSHRGPTPISKQGSSRLRKALYMPAIAARKFNPLLAIFAQRLQDKGLAPMAILCAIMRKLLHLAFGVIKSGKPFDPNYLNLRPATS